MPMGWHDHTRVNKFSTFDTKKKLSKSIQHLPKLFVNNHFVPQLETGKFFRYFARYFDFNMSDEEHKLELCDTFQDLIRKIDELQLNLKNNILLYCCYLLSKISWHFTVSDLSKPAQKVDNIGSKYIRKWLGLPISGSLK